MSEIAARLQGIFQTWANARTAGQGGAGAAQAGLSGGLLAGGLSSSSSAPADQLSLLRDPAVAYQIAQNPLLAGSILLNANAAFTAQPANPGIDADVQEFAEHFGLDARITKDLDDELKKRPATWEGDLVALWDILENARNPAGLLRVKIGEMQANTFVGQPTMNADIKKMQKMYNLDEQASWKLAEVLQQRGNKAEDIECMHRHLETSNKPSARVMMMLGKLRSGEKLPDPDKRIAPGSYLDKMQNLKDHKSDRDRERDRDRDRQRSRSRDRGRDRDRRRSRSRSRRRRSRSRR
eukprot:TRINITY_DN62996_c0_g1_i1.p1 TRINITY_DN62996_c0_g1~~TRINITY_DN62996_c0_g1_i1.p1  ORF type:complete len:309 (+),score=51.55 TRINITY_DN62996_c0_g1_i1:44-928(+)